jgi:hypothetical protein
MKNNEKPVGDPHPPGNPTSASAGVTFHPWVWMGAAGPKPAPLPSLLIKKLDFNQTYKCLHFGMEWVAEYIYGWLDMVELALKDTDAIMHNCTLFCWPDLDWLIVLSHLVNNNSSSTNNEVLLSWKVDCRGQEKRCWAVDYWWQVNSFGGKAWYKILFI